MDTGSGDAGASGAGRSSSQDRPDALRELGRSVGLLGTQRLGMMLFGAARTKVAATLLGPAGMGLLAQALTMQELLRQSANFGTSRGFLKLVSEYGARRDRAQLERLLVTATALVSVLSVVLAAACFVFAAPIAGRVFHDPTRALLVRLSAVTVVAAIPGAMCARVFNGLLDLRSFALLVLVESAVSVVTMAVLAGRFHLEGAVASFAVAELIGGAIGALLLWRRTVRPLGLDLRPRRPDGPILRRLLRYSSALTVTSLAAAAAALFVRGEILRQAGAEANGLYQVAWQVGQNYLGILGASLWSYGMPKVASQLDDPQAIVDLQNDFLRIAVLVLAPGVVLLLVARDLWIPILYSRAFLGVGATIAWQLSGELLAMMRQSMNISLLPRERLGFLVGQGVGYWALWAALAFALLPRLGALAAPISYCAANAVLLVVSYAYHRARLGYRIERDNRVLLMRTLPGFAIAIVMSQADGWLVGRLAPIALVLLWAFWHRRFLVRLRALV